MLTGYSRSLSPPPTPYSRSPHVRTFNIFGGFLNATLPALTDSTVCQLPCVFSETHSVSRCTYFDAQKEKKASDNPEEHQTVMLFSCVVSGKFCAFYELLASFSLFDCVQFVFVVVL